MWLGSVLAFFVARCLAQETIPNLPEYFPCRQLLYSRASDTPVCACDSDYCDTVAPVEPIQRPLYLTYTTSKGGLRLFRNYGSFDSYSIVNATIILNPSKTYQKMIGWGGAFSDSTGINVNALDPQAAERLIRSYYSKDGLEYNMGRVPIGGSDFSSRVYSYDDGETDTSLNNFALQFEDYTYKIPLIKQALNLTKELLLFGSNWIAPNWIQTSDDQNLGYINKSLYQAWADYYIKFLEAYKNNSIDIWAITTGNEPFFQPQYFDHPYVIWTPRQLRTWVVKNLGPTLRSSPFKDVKIITLDDQRFCLQRVLTTLLRTSSAQNYTDGIAVHWYYDTVNPPSLLDKAHAKYPSKFLLNTESSVADAVHIGVWGDAEKYAADIIQDTNHWVAGWVDWNLALDLEGGPNFLQNFISAAINVDAQNGVFYKNPTFYALGHFSKFVSKDSVRIDYRLVDGSLQTVAFRRPDNGTVVVVLNSNDFDSEFILQDPQRGYLSQPVDAHSITTVVYW